MSSSPGVLESCPRMTQTDTPPGLLSPTATSFSSRSSPPADNIWTSHMLAPLPMLAYDEDHSMEDDQEFRQTPFPAAATSSLQLPPLSSLFPDLPLARPQNTDNFASSTPFFSSNHDRPRPGVTNCPGSSRLAPAAPVRSSSGIFSSFMTRTSCSPSLIEKSVQSRSENEPRWTVRDNHIEKYKYDAQKPPCRQLSISRDALLGNEDGQTSSVSNSKSEASCTTYGLGPKIWTGTHFLPRFVRAADVPGEGMCYFYDDGTHCKTVIDGEAVIAHWGVTKAGKPRKRLAIACVTCREKKIKCDPDFPRCIQCEKFGRICSFKNAPRGGQNSSSYTSTVEIHTEKTASPPRDFQRSRYPACQPTHDGQLKSDGNSHKRLKVDAESYSPAMSVSLPMFDRISHSGFPLQPNVEMRDDARISDDILHRAWHTDVYLSNPQSIFGVVTQFFAYIDSSMILKFLPESTWKSYLSDATQRKLPEDLMLLYSVLTIGVALSGTAKTIALEYAQVAHYAQKNTAFDCLQLVQSRILLAAFYVSIHRTHDAAELLSSATRTATSLQLNVELERSSEADRATYPLGLNRAGYKESRRRTMWSLFMLERHNELFPNRSIVMTSEHLYIRLPTDDLSFEKQIERNEPAFDVHGYAVSYTCGSQNVHANLVALTSLWTDCQGALYRSACQPAAASPELTKVQALGKRIRTWYTSLPEYLAFSISNLEDCLYSGSAGSFLSIHILYHHAMIKVNRYHAAADLSGHELQSSYAHTCFGHATGILDLIRTFGGLRRNRSALNKLPRITAIATVEAVDVLTANGPFSGIKEQINIVKEALLTADTLVGMWEDLRKHKISITRRLDKLVYIRDHGPQPTNNLTHGYKVVDTGREICWQILEPMDRMLSTEMDIVYSIRL